MRKRFAEYYPPSEAELDALWQRGAVVLDANVLLSVYRCAEATRRELLMVLDKLKERLWVPYQFAWEYQRRRLDVIADQAKAYADAGEHFKRLIRDFESDRPPFINVKKLESLKEAAQELESERMAIMGLLTEDPHRDTLSDMLVGRVGEQPTAEFRAELIAKSRDRFAKGIPPGNRDEKKGRRGEAKERRREEAQKPREKAEAAELEGKAADAEEKARDATAPVPVEAREKENAKATTTRATKSQQCYANATDGGTTDEYNMFGDCLGWLEILEHQSTQGKPCLLITDDRKDDWWQIAMGHFIGPRPELVREYAERCGGRFHMYLPSRLLKWASERGWQVNTAAIEGLAELEHHAEKATNGDYDEPGDEQSKLDRIKGD